MLEFNLKLTENEVGYIVNQCLPMGPMSQSLPLVQKIVAQVTSQANAPANDPVPPVVLD